MTAILESGVVPVDDLVDSPWPEWIDTAEPWEPVAEVVCPDVPEPYVPDPLPDFSVRVLVPFSDGLGDATVPMLPDFPVLNHRLPVAALAGILESVEPADLRGAHLVNAIMGWEQAICAAQAAQAELVRELATQMGANALRDAGDELASALVCTRQAAERMVVRAVQAAEHPPLSDAWSAGLIGSRKIDIILDEVAVADRASDVVADALDAAGELTAPQLARHVRAAVIGADAAAAQRRAARERADRRVELTPARDAMAWIGAYLPADQALAVFTTVDALAGTTRVDGDPRTADQRRADAFADIFVGILERQTTPDGTPLPTRGGQRVAVQLTVAATTLLGLDEAPAYLGSFGPIPASMARELAQDGTWRRVLTDPAGQVCEVGSVAYRPGADLTRLVQARDQTCTFPGCRQPAVRCDLDHREPYDHGRPGDVQTCEANLHCLCRHHHQAKTEGRWKVTYDRATGESTWTSPLGITHVRRPQPVLSAAPVGARRPEPPPPAPRDRGDPPF
ncbi:HNH endonuclease signature motif containing protein [Cellulomonas sp. ICMP 17802]|uniref:HNH endonuclease signature motif containing protein n=1 Tax=Cellulomonas sp. ICMP 17802 TaxID=3239199 RepID=UPI00351B5281